MGITVSIYHDRRRKLKDGQYPVKIRVHSDIGHIAKFYAPFQQKITLSEIHFENMMSKRVKGDLRELKLKLDAVVSRYNDEASQLEVFSFKTFEFNTGRDKSKTLSVFDVFETRIENMKDNGQVGNYENYSCAMNSLKKFTAKTTYRLYDQLPFIAITPSWLEKYENWMLNDNKRSLNTVSFYTRTLRAVFNYAIKSKLIRQEIYPFGKGKYEIPSVSKVKKALSKGEFEILISSNPDNEFERKAKDIWLLSYYLQGINIRDLIKIRFRHIHNDTLIYHRAKTITSKRKNNRPVIVYLSSQAWYIINKYKRAETSPDDFLFEYLTGNENQEEVRRKTQKLTRYVNQHIQSLAPKIGINPNISTNYARHTFATNIISNGGGIEMAKELLNHSSTKVTEGYFSGFADEVKRSFLQNLYKNE